jgi:hypothetical protein
MNPSWLERLFFGQNIRGWSDWAHQFTRGKYLLAARPDVSKWQPWEHELTGWKHYVVPEGDVVDVFKFRSRVRLSEPFEWPALIRDQCIGPTNYAKANLYGNIPGSPMQQCGTETRPLTYGYAEYGKQETTRIPIPLAGWWWLTGHPNPAYDRHWTGVAPDGSVHECIQLDPNAEPTKPPFPNQALGWARYVDGALVEGTGATMADLPASAYCWDFRSSKNPHELFMVLADYIGGDGAREPGSGWPEAKGRYCLDRQSESYLSMKALGGECAAFAEAAAEFGMIVGDRNGYADTGHKPGLQPRQPTLHVQSGRQWGQTNMHLFKIRLGDLRRVIYAD